MNLKTLMIWAMQMNSTSMMGELITKVLLIMELNTNMKINTTILMVLIKTKNNRIILVVLIKITNNKILL